MSKFIPKVLLIGNENEIPNDLPEFKIVGKIEFRQIEPEVLQLVINGESLSESKLRSIDFDYVLCVHYALYSKNKKIWRQLLPSGIFITSTFFKHIIKRGYNKL